MGWMTHDYTCWECNTTYTELVDRDNVPDFIRCVNCDAVANRMPSGVLLKGTVEEIVHGGRITNGKLYRKYTGFKEVAEQRKLEKEIKKEKRKKNKEAAGEATKALESLKRQGRK